MAANPFIPTWLHRTVTVAHFINCFIVAATLIAYASEAFGGTGIFIQLFLGCYQLAVVAVATFAYWKWKVPAIWKLLKIYWLLILVWLVCACIAGSVINSIDQPMLITTFVLLPMLIAIYFAYVTYRIYSDFRN